MEKQIFYNGSILTMETPNPQESLVIENGRILFIGALSDARLLASGAEPRDLAGRTLMPAFLDAHGHFFAYANNYLQVSLAGAKNFAEIQTRIQHYIAENQIPPGAWVTAVGYDHNTLEERRHPDKQFLDSFFPEYSVVLQHQSGHMGVFNSQALARLDAETAGRDSNGYLEEDRYLSLVKRVPLPSPADLSGACAKAQASYAARGITTVQEGMLVPEMVPLYQLLLEKKALILDIVGYSDFQKREQILAAFPQHRRHYKNHFKLGGYKIFLDGSPQGRTAWMRTPYLPAAERHFGVSTMTDQAVESALLTAVEDDMQLLAHCNGDAACAQLLQAAQALRKKSMDPAPIRPVLIHGQLLAPDQIPAVWENHIIPSFFTAHIYHWGDIHIQNFGRRRAATISPAASALAAGLPFTMHQDSPVIQPDMLETIWCAVCRRTKAGVILGERERIPVYDALRAITINAAYQYFEEREKGSLQPGKSADLVILDQNPLALPPDSLRDIQVLETIKAGKTIYQKSLDKP